MQFVGAIDDGNTPAALARGRAEKRYSLAYVFDADHGVELAGLLVDHAIHHQKIALRLHGDAPRDRIVGIDRKRCRFPHRRRLRIGMREHETRQAIGQRCLADAGRPADQPSMGHVAAFIGLKQRAFGFFMTEQHAGFARML